MAAVPPSDQAVDLLQKLSLDSQTKNTEISERMKKPSSDSGNGANGHVQSVDRSVTPSSQDFHLPGGYASTAYSYGGYDGNSNEWNEYARYVNLDGLEMTPGVYADNGSIIYHHGYGYAPYSPYSPVATGSSVPTLGHDVHQLYGAQQHYQYPTTPYFQQPTPTTANQAASILKGDISTTSGAPDIGQVSLSVDTAVNGDSTGFSSSTGGGGALKGNTTTSNISGPVRSAYKSSSLNGNSDWYGRGSFLPAAASDYQDLRFSHNYNNGYDGTRSPIPWTDGPLYSDVYHPRNLTSSMNLSSISNNNNGNCLPTSRHHQFYPQSHPMGMHHPSPTTGNAYMNRTNKLYGGVHHGNTFRSSLGFGSNYNSNNAYASRTNGVGLGWLPVDNKLKLRGRSRNGLCGHYGNENIDGLNELNRGPRTINNSLENQNDVGFTLDALVMQDGEKNFALAGANDIKDDYITRVIPDRDQYNRVDFPVHYEDAKFFIIKSYSEDDVHKSIKYNVWSSTQNGNKKLDAVYQEAQQKPVACPIFLFFSVNTSGQFVGVAEMVGPVDFNTSVEYWQQDKWIGCFPVKWHIVKDVPNTLLKHITLENNENKPVTNSRDTQEVKLEQGLQLLKIFKDHCSEQCILDDFDFYADRQRRIEEKKAKQQAFNKQVLEGNVTVRKNKVSADTDLKIENTVLDSAPPIVDNSCYIKVSDNNSPSV